MAADRCSSSSAAAAADTTTHPGARTLVVFDFDWSLVNENSDTYVVRELAPEVHAEMGALRREGGFPGWTELMDECFRRMHERGVTRAAIEACLAGIPTMPEMLQAAAEAAACERTDVAILSDANTALIDAILPAVGLREAFAPAAVRTNPARWEGDRLHVERYYRGELAGGAAGHPARCPAAACPSNLCKSLVLAAELRRPEHARVLYVGDGGGDYCPAAHALGPGDVVLARAGYPLHRRCEADAAAGRAPRAAVVPWATGREVLDEFRRHIGANRGQNGL